MRLWKYILGILFLVVILLWIAALGASGSRLHLIACDVGQGDAILVTHGDFQLLTDGGPPNRRVLECLAAHMPFWDRNIELVILTHPQLDHYGGFLDVFPRYKVENFMTIGLDSNSQEFQIFKKMVEDEGSKLITSVNNRVLVSGLIRLEVLWPSETYLASSTNEAGNSAKVLGSFTSGEDPNFFSTVYMLSFGEFDALLTGDIVPETIDDLLATGGVKDIEYLKVPHHGSKNGLTRELLDASSPEIAVISAGAKNSYGHPHKEVLEMLSSYGLRILRTDELGDVEVVSDGKSWAIVGN